MKGVAAASVEMLVALHSTSQFPVSACVSPSEDLPPSLQL